MPITPAYMPIQTTIPPFINNIINELMGIEAQAKNTQERSYKARKTLEDFYSPATRKGKKREEEEAMNNKLAEGRRKTMMRRIEKKEQG